jgi:hypothetical protein
MKPILRYRVDDVSYPLFAAIDPAVGSSHANAPVNHEGELGRWR